MSGTESLVALEVLLRVREEQFPGVSEDLLKAAYEREHEFQFEDDRGTVRAALRDLIAEEVGEGPA